MKLSGAVRFAFAARAPDEVLDLEELTIGVASLGTPDLDFSAVSAKLDALAEEVADHISLSAPPDRLAAQLSSAFGGRLGFRGDASAYSDPEHSYLDAVLERRRGMPILLSVVWMLLGKRLGVPIHGIGYPGHTEMLQALAAGPQGLPPGRCRWRRGNMFRSARNRMWSVLILPANGRP